MSPDGVRVRVESAGTLCDLLLIIRPLEVKSTVWSAPVLTDRVMDRLVNAVVLGNPACLADIDDQFGLVAKVVSLSRPTERPLHDWIAISTSTLSAQRACSPYGRSLGQLGRIMSADEADAMCHRKVYQADRLGFFLNYWVRLKRK